MSARTLCLQGRTVQRAAVMGTVFTFDLRCGPGGTSAETAIGEAVRWLQWVDVTFSPYRPDSQVNRFDRGELTAGECCPELRHVIALCHRFNEQTRGYFDAWASGRFDPCGIVKGWATEEASLMLARRGFLDHMVDGGGDIVLCGSPLAGPQDKWSVGIRHPTVRSAYCAALRSGPGAVATSGTYERGRHIWDPLRQAPAGYLTSVTVVGPGLLEADAYATAAVAMGPSGPRWLAGLERYESLAISVDGRAWVTPGFQALGVELPA